MSTRVAVKKCNPVPGRRHGAGCWLSFAVSPVFAKIPLATAIYAPGTAICSSTSGVLPVDDMTCMYLLKCPFYQSPLAATRFRPAGADRPIPNPD